MPTCFRCGKVLSSQSSLNYHLNKKYTCNQAWTCTFCDKHFQTKCDKRTHEISCHKRNQNDNFIKTMSSNITGTIHKINSRLNIIQSSDCKYIGKLLYCDVPLGKRDDFIKFVVSNKCYLIVRTSKSMGIKFNFVSNGEERYCIVNQISTSSAPSLKYAVI